MKIEKGAKIVHTQKGPLLKFVLFEKDKVILCFCLVYVVESQTKKQTNQEKLCFFGGGKKGGFCQKSFFLESRKTLTVFDDLAKRDCRCT